MPVFLVPSSSFSSKVVDNFSWCWTGISLPVFFSLDWPRLKTEINFVKINRLKFCHLEYIPCFVPLVPYFEWYRPFCSALRALVSDAEARRKKQWTWKGWIQGWPKWTKLWLKNDFINSNPNSKSIQMRSIWQRNQPFAWRAFPCTFSPISRERSNNSSPSPPLKYSPACPTFSP